MKRGFKIFPLIILSSIVLSGCSGSPFNSEDFTSRIFFNLWDFLAVFAAFIILILVAFFFAYKPIKKFIKNRGDYVEGKISEAEQREEKSRSLISEGEHFVSSSKKEAKQIIEKAQIDAKSQKEQILLEARQEATKEKEKARKEIELEIEANKKAIHDEIVDVAITASEELLSREVSDKDNKRFLDDFVSDLSKDKKESKKK